MGVLGGQTYGVFLEGDSKEQQFRYCKDHKTTIFSATSKLIVLDRNIERTQRSKCVAVRMYNRKDDGASGEISALRELSPPTIAFTGKCNTRGGKCLDKWKQ